MIVPIKEVIGTQKQVMFIFIFKEDLGALVKQLTGLIMTIVILNMDTFGLKKLCTDSVFCAIIK